MERKKQSNRWRENLSEIRNGRPEVARALRLQSAQDQRRDAAIAEGLKQVPVHHMRISDAKAKAMNLALNRISGEWDDDKLANLLRELEDLERGLTGFDEDEIAKLLGDSLAGRTVEEIAVKPPPEIVWHLIGIARARFGQVQEHIVALESAAELSIQSSRSK